MPSEPAITTLRRSGPRGRLLTVRPDLCVRLRGGAGNQLFQYAAARSIVPGTRVRLIPSTTVDQLSITALLPGRLTFVDEPAPTAIDHRTLYSQMGEFARAFEPRPRRLGRPRLIDGYFQHPSWFERSVRLVVRELLDAAPAGYRALCDGPPFAAVCIRRGDYLRFNHELGEGYYASCMEHLDPSLPIAFAGDDPGFAELLARRAEQAGRAVLRLSAPTLPCTTSG